MLAVDDEPKIRDIARACLEADGFTVTEEPDGPVGLRAAREQNPRPVVLHITLPGGQLADRDALPARAWTAR
ncbi:hypothetical protein ACIRYZ_14325 [Kitasatospora sp. NPDC101155]|uniref:hypothetical protein n=1 Tax=Kitasatospora sp. NPDC101155 TaxID=3364097 RepID=UPI0038307E24